MSGEESYEHPREERIPRLKRLVEGARAQYAGDPNVRAIGWGLKHKRAELQDELAIIFYVRRKLESDRAIAAAGSRPIPSEIEGVPTDVEEARLRRASAGDRDERQYDPLVGGVASSNAEGHIFWFNGGGTLGLLVHDAGGGAPMGLSNWHVWADGGDEGDAIIQPGHPTAADHVVALGKVAACGALPTALIEWEVPSPLAAGLYGGAAAAALAAAASDQRDPIRRGQDQTPTDPGELTVGEVVDMAIEYPQLPLPGTPFQTNVKWRYERQTQTRSLVYSVDEQRVNAQFLLGKMVTTDRTSYRPGERVILTAAIWDHQPRPCDAYHVVAHAISHRQPQSALRAVLHPIACPRTIPPVSPEQEDEEICVVFDMFDVGDYPSVGAFGWLSYVNPAQDAVHVVDWFGGTRALTIPRRTLQLSHRPAQRVSAQVAQFADPPVVLLARNAAGQPVGTATAPNQQGVVHELDVSGDGIVSALLRGGSGEGLLVSYCIDGSTPDALATGISQSIASGLVSEVPGFPATARRLEGNRCCFGGALTMPPNETAGKWDLHLTVQNVNTVPQGTPAEEAATVIGGHLLSEHTGAAIVGCVALMALDHVFDVI